MNFLILNQNIIFGRSERLFCFCFFSAVNACKCAAIIYFDRHQFRRLSLAVEQNNRHLTTRRQTFNQYRKQLQTKEVIWRRGGWENASMLLYVQIFFYTICLYYCTLFFYSCSWLLIWFPGWTGYSTGTMMTEVETNAFTVFFSKAIFDCNFTFFFTIFLQIFFLSLKSVFCILFSSHVVDC